MNRGRIRHADDRKPSIKKKEQEDGAASRPPIAVLELPSLRVSSLLSLPSSLPLLLRTTSLSTGSFILGRGTDAVTRSYAYSMLSHSALG